MLIKLCEKTEPDTPGETYLFNEHLIRSQEMLKEVRDLHTGKNNIDPDSEQDLLINIMKNSNKIWRLRNKIKNGEFDDLEWVEDDRNFDDFINSQNIEHIRIYDYALLEISRRLLKKLDVEI